MADHIQTHPNDNTSAATILISVVIVLIIALAFYFGVIRGNVGGSNAGTDNTANVELNVPATDGGTGTANGAAGY